MKQHPIPKRLGALLLCFALLVGLLPSAALAADGDTGFSWTLSDGSLNQPTSGTDVNLNKNLTGGSLTVTGGRGESISVNGTGSVDVTLSGDITSSGNISCTALARLNITGGNISAGGNISSQRGINISGGHVEANDIIVNVNSSSGNIRITIGGGIVKADSISVYNSSGNATGTQDLTINGDTVVFASSIQNQNQSVTPTKGVVFIDNEGTVYGNVNLPDGVTIPEGYELTIPSGTSLTVPEGTTLTNEGTITVESGGTFTNNGTIENYGDLPAGTGGTILTPATVTVNNASGNYGGSVTLTANVEGGSGAVNSGSVTFYQGTASGTSLGSANVSNATAQCIINNISLTPSKNPYTITAVYSGGTGLLGGQRPRLPHRVQGIPGHPTRRALCEYIPPAHG